MKVAWFSLIWKEWREYRGALVALTILYIVVSLAISQNYQLNSESFEFTALLLVPLTTLFVAVDTASRERSHRTESFLLALPITMAHAATIKLLAAAVALVVPIAMATLINQSVASWTGVSNPSSRASVWPDHVWGLAWDDNFVQIGCSASLAALSLLAWGAALGAGQPSETRAAALILATTLIAWLAGGWLFFDVLGATDDGPLRWSLMCVLPGGPGLVGLDRNSTSTSWLNSYAAPAVTCCVVHIALIGRFLGSFGRIGRADVKQAKIVLPTQKNATAWLNAPRKSPLHAIAWKQLRDTLPLAAVGCAIIIGVGIAGTWRQLKSFDVDATVGVLLPIGVYASFVVVLVAGIGLFVDDLRPGIHSFWRSRPVPIDDWFWTKYCVGICVPIGLMALPLVSVWGVFARQGDAAFEFLGWYAVFLLNVYGAAAAAMVLLRRPIVASVAAVGVLALALRAAAECQGILGPDPLQTFLVLGAVAFPLLAWQALRRDWGWVPDHR